MAKALTVETFDYSELKKDDKGKLMCIAAEVRRKIEAGRRTAFEIGESVACAHAILAIDGKDGKFSKWVEFEFGFSRQTAYNLMWSWERFGNCKTILQLDDSAMYALASPTVPEPAVKAAMKIAEKQRLTFGEVKEIIKQHTPDSPPKPTKTKSQASVTGGSDNHSAAPPSLPSVGTVNRTDEGSQGDGDAGECPPGQHSWTDDGDGEYCKACKVSREDAEVWPVVGGKVSGGITFDPKELTPQSVKDGFGDEVTGELRAAFAIRAEFQEKRQQLTNLKTWITQRVSHPGCAVLKSGESRIKTDIDNLDTELKFATPHCECVYCKNKMPKVANCNACKGRGWITQEIYKQAPKDLKRA